ncbi:MAG: diadenylate cyclase CdaA [Clostridia bacterium]|nr:diadenylate cyclase CdaA [Clostridia bacterium]
MAEILKNMGDAVIKLVLDIKWYDLIDIALVALVLYYCIKLVRQTRAFNLVKGIVFMGVVYFIVSTLNMSTSSYLFSHLFGDIVIVMILLFQPEIRQAIESFGRGDFKKVSLFSLRNGNYAQEELRTSASNIAKAAANMSEKKIGALIVIEGGTMLGEVLSTGTAIDSAISSAVIENVFFPKAPLHDGAMVIRDNRIHSAGCILPLTQNEISKELGTRHRAGIGVTEHSDALVVIVSEETGSISLANGGTLVRDLTLGELNEELTNYMVPEETKNGTFKLTRRKK